MNNPDPQVPPSPPIGKNVEDIPKPSRVLVQPIVIGDLNLANATTQTTVGAAGGASALPATPTGYLTINIGNSSFVVPYYATS